MVQQRASQQCRTQLQPTKVWVVGANVRSSPAHENTALCSAPCPATADNEHIGAALGTCAKIAHRRATGGLTMVMQPETRSQHCNPSSCCSRAQAPSPVPSACTCARGCRQIHQTIGLEGQSVVFVRSSVRAGQHQCTKVSSPWFCPTHPVCRPPCPRQKHSLHLDMHKLAESVAATGAQTMFTVCQNVNAPSWALSKPGHPG